MGVALGTFFVVIELVLIFLTIFVILRAGFLRLSSAVGIARDGFAPGKAVPSWSLPDIDGRLRVTPAGDRWQMLVFVNRSLEAFPEVVSGMHYLARSARELEVLVISQDSAEDCRATVQQLDLQVPVVPVEPAFYDRFRVHVMPFAFFLDPRGLVRWVGLIDTEAQIILAWRMARASLRSAEVSEVM